MDEIKDVEALFKKVDSEDAVNFKEPVYLFAIFTDEIKCEKWPLAETKKNEIVNKKRLLLELRIFNADFEYKLLRGDMGETGFLFRYINDKERDNIKIFPKLTDSEAKLLYTDFFDEYQYLDIDTDRPGMSKSEGLDVYATGGGLYHLPFENCNVEDLKFAVLKVRHYVARYPKTGKAYVCDWRCLGFGESEEAAGSCKISWNGGKKDAGNRSY